MRARTNRLVFLVVSLLLPTFGAVAAEEEGFTPLFNGRDLAGWVNVNCAPETWAVRDGLITCTGKPTGAMRTERQYENFIFEVEWRHLQSGGNAGIFIWSSPIAAPGVPFLRAIEVQVLDHGYGNNESHTTHGDVFPIHGSTMKPFGPHNGMRSFPTERRSKPSPEWNHYRIVCDQGVLRLHVNGKEVSGGEECNWRKGYIGLESEGAPTEWRNLRIKELPSAGATGEQSAPLAQGHRPLYNGADLRGWKCSTPERWQPNDWRLTRKGGPAGEPLWSEVEFGDGEFVVDCQIPKNATVERDRLPSVLLRAGEGDPVRVPLAAAQAGKWVRHTIQLKERVVTIQATGQSPERISFPGAGPVRLTVGLSDDGSPVEFANIYFRSEAAGPGATADLKPLFYPPPEWSGQLGNYRSPLEFEDGTRVTTAAEWSRRRQQIRRQWDGLMGAWPPLIEKPVVEYIGSEERETYLEHRVRVEIGPAQTIDGYLLVPRGVPKFPAVLVPFYEPETSIGLKRKELAFASELTRRGFVTLSIGSPGGDARKPPAGAAHWQPLSMLAYVAANCANALAHLPEVDASRLGVVGHSYGGKWAMFASCLYDRFACAVWCDPGIVFDEKRANVNYWEPWYLGLDADPARRPGIPNEANPRTGAYKAMVEQGLDLHQLHALMPPRPFLVSGGSEDPPERWQALNHIVAVNRVLGAEERVAMSNRPNHTPTPESNAQIFQFFEHFLLPRKG